MKTGVAVIGGGFAGLNLVKHLAQEENFRVTLVDEIIGKNKSLRAGARTCSWTCYSKNDQTESPALLFQAPADSNAFAELTSAISRVQNAPATEEYMRAARDSSLVRELVAGQLSLEWAVTRVISDDPTKGLGLASPD
jgi:glycine/D-amino acid oxidase-like deaminating enzyme